MHNSNSQPQHSPGEWCFVGRDDAWSGYFIVEIDHGDSLSPKTRILVDAPPGASNAEAEANAHLIAAAPELLAALELIAQSDQFNGGSYVKELQNIARAAIAKARA